VIFVDQSRRCAAIIVAASVLLCGALGFFRPAFSDAASLNVDELAVRSLDHDVTEEINRLLHNGRVVKLPPATSCYQVKGTLRFTSGSGLIASPTAELCAQGLQPVFEVPGNANDVSFSGIKIVGQSKRAPLGIVRGSGFRWRRGGASLTGPLIFSGAKHCVVADAAFTHQTGDAIVLTKGASYCQIRRNELQANAGMGIIIGSGAHHNLISSNWTDANRLELVGVQYDAFGNTIANNHVSGTGDNGISISGCDNRVIGNKVIGAALTGIFIYGSRNHVQGNVVRNSGQAHNPDFRYFNAENRDLYAGIEINGAFGGFGQDNVVVSNSSEDDQITPTQAYGFQLGSGYAPWRANTAYPSKRYIYMNGRIYRARSAGVSGDLIPHCVSGACSDGGISWEYVATAAHETPEPFGNTLINPVPRRGGVIPISDQTRIHANKVIMTSTR
jgi:parallel beta-helix repeat protein